MLEIDSLEDIAALRESVDIECKLALGRDGKGALPKDIWETYSAFANTQGGDIFLGLKENSNRQFELVGIAEPHKILDELWNTANNSQKVSANILRESSVRILTIDGQQIIQIHVHQATRKQKPIYINGNPMRGTYKRLNSGDVLPPEETIKRMLAEQVEDSRDHDILTGYSFEDLSVESFNEYRQLYSNLHPDHIWNKADSQEFLYFIGGWARDRETGRSGLTKAGLLMFGALRPIKEAFPNYMLDYQERPEPKFEQRWVDRLTLDGNWSGNLFDFYRRVIRKLTADIKVPFVLEGDQRQDDTNIHKALREALVNTLVHADYTGRASVLVVKRPDMFGFRNPGLMRVPADIAIAGGQSDCRNRALQDMFRFINLGENAGSGLPKIYYGWQTQHWRQPVLREKQEPNDQTLLELHMLSLVPETVLAELRASFDTGIFDHLSENERLILVTAKIEKTVDHARMMSILNIHARDLTQLFGNLVDQGLLLQDGAGRGTVYFLMDARLDDAFTEFTLRTGQTTGAPVVNSGGLNPSSGGLAENSGGLDALKVIAESIATRKKAPKEEMEAMILKLCAVRPLLLGELEVVLNRSPDFLRKDYLQPMVKARKLRLLFPTAPNHPQQAYITE